MGYLRKIDKISKANPTFIQMNSLFRNSESAPEIHLSGSLLNNAMWTEIPGAGPNAHVQLSCFA